MKKVRNFIIHPFCLIALLSLTTGLVSGQVTADFTSNKTAGCSPQTIIFNNLSTGPITYWEWRFGNGNTSFLKNPVATYGDPGKYTVTLIVSDGANRDTLTLVDYITIYKNPVADFTGTGGGKGCQPFTVNFNDLTTLGDGSINQWIWDFGDGNINNSGNPNPTHTYTTTGSYPVSLQVIDVNGCSSNLLIPNYVQVSESPNLSNITANVTSACTPPLAVNFGTTTSGSGPFTFQWDFGDGTTTNQPTPSHTYTSTGGYNVTVIVTNSAGCSDTLVKPNFIIIDVPTAGINLPDTVCVNTNVTFGNSSSGASSYRWNFGDGGTSNSVQPVHKYNATGTYTVTLIARDGSATCQDTVTKTIEVIDMIANFSSTPNYGCQLPHTVNFTDLSTGAVSWQWNFGNGATSAQKNPTYTYNTAGTYTVTLVATNAYGCKKTIVMTNHVVINPIDADFSPDIDEGCAPLTVNFTDQTSSDSTITSWQWVFDDGNTSSQQNPTNTFMQDGDFTVTLVVTNKLGCVDSVKKVIEVGKKMTPDFSVDRDTTCAFDGANFTDLSIDSLGLIDYWYWNHFGDGGTDPNPDPFHQYVDTGWMTVTLITGYNGCYDTLEVDSVIYVQGPIVSYTAPANCDHPLDYDFTSDMKDAQRWYWNFGDGSSIDSTSIDPSHTFPARGSYTVSLDAFNDSTGCYWHFESIITVTVPQAEITNDTVIGCLPYTHSFSGLNSQDAYYYQWTLGNGVTSTTGTPTTKYTSTGLFPVTLIVTDVHNCKDTTYGQVKVIDPVANYTIDAAEGCVPLTVNFTDNSLSDTTLVSWLWDFGDGGTSTLQNPAHIYTTNGLKTVKLIVTDAIGCKDTLDQTNLINSKQPTPKFTVSDQSICLGDSVLFTDQSTGKAPLTYFWTFSDGSTSTLKNPYHTFPDTGYFDVTLTVTDSDGCDSSITKLNYVHVQGIPVALISSNKTVTQCYPDLILFKDSSLSDYVSQWQWDFGDGGVSTLEDPGHNYTQPGEYDVSLIVTTTYGCKDTIELIKYIQINGPYAEFHLQPDTICKGEMASFFIDTTFNVTTWDWDFGDGAGQAGSGTSTTHIYNQTGQLFPTLIYQSSNGCTQYFKDTIYIHQIVADFVVSDTASCIPLITSLTDISTGPDQWHWDFGDGSTSTQQNTNHTYNTPGSYDIMLSIFDNTTGCRDTIIKTVNAYNEPITTITPSGTLCAGDSLQLLSTGGGTYMWSPSTWLSDTTIANPWTKPQGPIQYIVVVTDTNGCVGSDTVSLGVQNKPNLNLPGDTTIIIGEVIDNMDGYAGSGFNYRWTPPHGLSCTDCPFPEAIPLSSTCYKLTVTDPNNCFLAVDSMCIDVDVKFSMDVPKAFTPNGDGVNDVIYVRGWGIQDLLEFTIYNRWGEVVFQTSDVKEGWDGFYKGKLQNIETYAYTASAKLYNGEIRTKKGYIALLR
ncbi:MAG: PKD domain-containing protein [Flavobacteriales bacterium]|nr:PKD domain-containing protein [Flavobacteriales bacterium]